MKNIMKKWRLGTITAKQAIKELGELMAEAHARGESVARFECAVNEVLGMPSDPQTGDLEQMAAWESWYRH